MQDFYETTLDALKDAKNERLWFKTMTKLGKLYFDREDYGKLSRILNNLGFDYEEKVLPSIGSEVLKSIVAQYDAT